MRITALFWFGVLLAGSTYANRLEELEEQLIRELVNDELEVEENDLRNLLLDELNEEEAEDRALKDSCKPNGGKPCANGECIEGRVSEYCLCLPGYTGDTCDECQDGYTGDPCEKITTTVAATTEEAEQTGNENDVRELLKLLRELDNDNEVIL